MKYVRPFGIALLIASVIYFVRVLWTYADSMPAITWDVVAVASVVSALGLYVVQFVTSGFAWHLWLKAVGEPSRPSRAVILTALSQFAKYIPGSLAQHIARIALARRYGISATGAMVTISFEMAWAITAGAVMGIIAAGFLGLPQLGDTFRPSLAMIIAIAAMAIGLPGAAFWMLGPHRPAWVDRWLRLGHLRHPDLPTFAGCFFLYALNQLLCGVIMALLGAYIFGAGALHLPLNIGVFAVAWIAGVIVLVAPGGIGVREAVLLAGLAPTYGPGTALGMAIGYRVISTVGDGIGFLWGFQAERGLNRRTPAPEK